MQNVVFYVGKYKLSRNNNNKIIYVKMNYQNSCSFLGNEKYLGKDENGNSFYFPSFFK